MSLRKSSWKSGNTAQQESTYLARVKLWVQFPRQMDRQTERQKEKNLRVLCGARQRKEGVTRLQALNSFELCKWVLSVLSTVDLRDSI